MTTPNQQKFDARSGCQEHGNTFEFLVAAQFGLLLSLRDDVLDFKLSINNNDLGSFDDVVVEIKHSDGTHRLYALQLKHHIGKKGNISTQALGGAKGEFSLKKYSEAFNKTEEMCQHNKSYDAAFENFHFILYTNQALDKFHTVINRKKVDADELKLDPKLVIYKDDKCVAGGMINSSESDEGFVYKFRDENQRRFFKQFALYTKQLNAEQVELRISKLILKLFENCNPNVITNYINFFKFWWRGDFGLFKLTKKDIMAKLTEYVLISHIPEVATIEIDDEKISLLNDTFNSFDVVVVEDSTSIEAIWAVILKDFKSVDLSTWSLPLVGSFFPENTRVPMAAQGENFIEQSLKKVYLILWHMRKLPLVVRVKDRSRKSIYAAIELCQKAGNNYKFFLLDPKFQRDAFSDGKIFQNWCDLSPEIRNKIGEIASVSLQGRRRVSLNQLLKIPTLKILFSAKEIIRMLTSDVVLGNDCNERLSNYITRFCPKLLLSSRVVDNVEDLFVVSLQGFKTAKEQLSSKALFVDDLCSHEQFQEVCRLNPNRNCHHVRALKKDTLEWVKSRGTIALLRPYQLVDSTNSVQDTDVLNYFSHEINVLCAPPGMGKSILLRFFRYNCPSDRWVLYINLGDQMKFFKQHRTYEQIVERFIGDDPVVRAFASAKKMLFLWDAFDELPKVCGEHVISAITSLAEEGYSQWISARTNSKEFLEDAFGVFAVTISHFNEEDQKRYVYNHLKTKFADDEKIESMVSTLNEKMSSLSNDYLSSSGVPLQIYMIMEIFLKNPEKYLELKIVTLADIYAEFIDGKFTELYHRAGASADNHIMQKIQKKFKESRLQQYEIAALKATFDDETFSRLDLHCHDFLKKISNERDNLGLIWNVTDENKPVFSHKTYEEFLTASWLVKNYRKFPQLIEKLFDHDHRNVRCMFDMILAKDSPDHGAPTMEILKTNANESKVIDNEILKMISASLKRNKLYPWNASYYCN